MRVIAVNNVANFIYNLKVKRVIKLQTIINSFSWILRTPGKAKSRFLSTIFEKPPI